jgi:hypothetical protein
MVPVTTVAAVRALAWAVIATVVMVRVAREVPMATVPVVGVAPMATVPVKNVVAVQASVWEATEITLEKASA